MEANKPWYLSRTIWASAITVVLAAGGLLGLAVEAGDELALTDAFMELIAAVAGILAIIGRMAATARIG